MEPKARNMFTGHLYDIMPADAIPDGAKLQFAFGTVDSNMHIMNETWILDRRSGYVAEYGSVGDGGGRGVPFERSQATSLKERDYRSRG